MQQELLCVAAQYGDVESVRYLLREVRVPIPQETGEKNPAIQAAHSGQHHVVRELLDSIPCESVTKSIGLETAGGKELEQKPLRNGKMYRL